MLVEADIEQGDKTAPASILLARRPGPRWAGQEVREEAGGQGQALG